MSNSILENFLEKLSRVSDDELLAMGSINIKQYQTDLITLILKEIERRGISNDVQEVVFDIFVNVNGYAGRLILLEEQLLFLSIGLKAKSGSSSGGGLIGGLSGSMRDADRGKQFAFASELNFSALENEGSWICFLDEITRCGAKSSWFSGKEMEIEILEDGANQIIHKAYCDELFLKQNYENEFNSLPLKIDNAVNKFKKQQGLL